MSPERRQKLAQLLVRKAAAVESINQEHRAYFFRRQAGEPMVISNERMREMLDELFDYRSWAKTALAVSLESSLLQRLVRRICC